MKNRLIDNLGRMTLFTMILMLFSTSSLAAGKKTELTGLTLPFGTPNYTMWMAFEETMKKSNSWVDWKTKETPGAMYIIKYVLTNQRKMAAGQVPYYIVPSESGLIQWMSEGWAPLQKAKMPNVRAIFSLPAVIALMVTFDGDIKDMNDMAGKKIGLAGKARLFQTDFANRPYFDEKGLGIWDKINWQYLGSINSKDALLNNKVDVKLSYFYGNLKIAADGSYYCTKLIPEAPTLELMDAGRKLHFVGWDPKVIKKTFGGKGTMALMPILIKKGALKGIGRDVWGKFSAGQAQSIAGMSDEMVEELIRIRYFKRKDLEKYHAMLKLLPDTPYPIGTPKHLVHSGVFKAMKKLGLEIPE